MDTDTPTPRRKNGKARLDARTIARRSVATLCLASALGFGGYAAYQAFGTDAPAQAHAADVLNSITTQVVASETGGEGQAGRAAISTIAPEVPSAVDAEAGEAFGTISHPLFGPQPLVKSDRRSTEATQALIDTGVVAAYESRENPGEPGNFAVIGHRITHGSVFNRAPELREGDVVKVETADATFTYRVIREAFRVEPDEPSILAPMNGKEPSILSWLDDDYKNKEDAVLMTLITCGDWMTNHREVIVLELVPKG